MNGRFREPYGRYGWVNLSPDALRCRLQQMENAFKEILKNEQVDAIAFCGSSGAPIAFHLSVQFNIPVIYVRKEGENSHGCRIEYNAFKNPEKYVIVDDFIASGRTVQYIYDTIKKHCKNVDVKEAKPVGIICYEQDDGENQHFKLGRKTLRVHGF